MGSDVCCVGCEGSDVVKFGENKLMGYRYAELGAAWTEEQ